MCARVKGATLNTKNFAYAIEEAAVKGKFKGVHCSRRPFSLALALLQKLQN